MKNALVIASVASMIDQFNMPNIELLRRMGYHVDVACNFREGNTCTKEQVARLKKTLTSQGTGCFQIDFARDVTKLRRNGRAYRQLRAVAENKKYSLVHCHAPIGGVLGRIVFRKYRKKGTRVIYTAHGFHFFKGAPAKNWLLYYPVEKLLSRWTDCLVTINREDYKRAKKGFYAKRTVYVPGIGIDLEKIAAIRADRREKRREIGIPENAYMLLSVGELSVRKNHKLILRALGELGDRNIYYVICGQGELENELRQYAKAHGMSENVRFLGYRTDVLKLCKTADLFVFPSLQEGLPVALMEAMACGALCIASDIRGNRDLFGEDGKGCLLSPDRPEDWIQGILRNMTHPGDPNGQAEKNKRRMLCFSKDRVMRKTEKIYRGVLPEEV